MRDDALSEITGFLLILSLVILFAAVFTAAALPDILEQQAREEREDRLFRFAGIKEGIDFLTLAKNPSLTRKETLPAPLFGSHSLSLTYGKPVMYAGVTYHEAFLTYEAEDFTDGVCKLTLGASGMKKDSKSILPSSYRIVVDSTTAEQRETVGTFCIEYSWQGEFVHEGQTFQIFSLRLT